MVSAYGPGFGLDEKACIQIAAAFGGGMGRLQEVCGVVTGAFMVIGLKHGEKSMEQEGRKKVYGLVQDFARLFKSRNNSISCRELLGIDLSTKEGLVEARTSGVFQTKCPAFVRDSVEILEKLL